MVQHQRRQRSHRRILFSEKRILFVLGIESIDTSVLLNSYLFSFLFLTLDKSNSHILKTTYHIVNVDTSFSLSHASFWCRYELVHTMKH